MEVSKRAQSNEEEKDGNFVLLKAIDVLDQIRDLMGEEAEEGLCLKKEGTSRLDRLIVTLTQEEYLETLESGEMSKLLILMEEKVNQLAINATILLDTLAKSNV